MNFSKMEIGKLEDIEKLEQLRALENSMSIGVVVVDYNPIGVDTPEDLEKVRKLMEAK
jgi:3-deoxy-manno-octulosonate cytidylyltransferase (CMP-KDO synthetase)